MPDMTDTQRVALHEAAHTFQHWGEDESGTEVTEAQYLSEVLTNVPAHVLLARMQDKKQKASILVKEVVFCYRILERTDETDRYFENAVSHWGELAGSVNMAQIYLQVNDHLSLRIMYKRTDLLYSRLEKTARTLGKKRSHLESGATT